MRNTIRSTRASGRVGMVVLLVATMVAMLLGPVGVAPAVAQDDLSIQTRVQVLHADPALGQVEVFINDDEVLDEFTYGQQSDWIDFQPAGPASRLPRTGPASTTPSSTRSTRLPPTTITT